MFAPERLRLVEAARDAWVSRLIDVSRRNNLLFFQPSTASAIGMEAEDPVVADLLACKSVSADLLFPERETKVGEDAGLLTEGTREQ
ncbi:hypothetical protein [Terriglobus sp.]|uniref:hypothetical protein n=1 Tax=Terriglobus sp. TaxID=1889013 RepID=UPI003AFF8B59